MRNFVEKGHCRDIFEAVKASASMPFVSPMVDVDGIPCLDGGCSCKIPYQWTIDSGYENIVVVKTRERGFRKDPEVKNTTRLFYCDNPEFALKLDESNAAYDQQCDEIDEVMMMLTYVIVGSGYRSEYYGRIAADHPDLFKAMFLCRSGEKVKLVTEHTGIPATTDVNEALSIKPDFVVIAVDREHVADVTEEWALRGFPVVTETPVGSSIEKLEKIWKISESKNAKVVCCEQYHRHPVLAKGLSAIKEGLLGTPQTGYLSLVHDYHAASILRRMLLTSGEDYVMHGERKASAVTETDSRYGAFYDGRIGQEVRDIVHISYDSGKTAVYDFASVEYRSYIRSRHLTVRCDKGEWSDRIQYLIDGDHNPTRNFLMPDIPEKYHALDTQSLRDGRRTWQPELQLDTIWDEYAIATILLDMKDYMNGGASPYPLKEALDDALFWLTLQEAVKEPWKEIRVPKTIWNS